MIPSLHTEPIARAVLLSSTPPAPTRCTLIFGQRPFQKYAALARPTRQAQDTALPILPSFCLDHQEGVRNNQRRSKNDRQAPASLVAPSEGPKHFIQKRRRVLESYKSQNTKDRKELPAKLLLPAPAHRHLSPSPTLCPASPLDTEQWNVLAILVA